MLRNRMKDFDDELLVGFLQREVMRHLVASFIVLAPENAGFDRRYAQNSQGSSGSRLAAYRPAPVVERVSCRSGRVDATDGTH